MPDAAATALLANEAESLLTRLARLRSFALFETMVPAAAVTIAAQAGIERQLSTGRSQLRSLIGAFLQWLHSPSGQSASASEAQHRFTIIRLRFNLAVTQFDIFADVMTQRSEHQTGVWLAGLDALAGDSLALPGYYDAPPVVCYLDRGHGAAIRRARTRLPGGGSNPVGVIRIPRERMIGSGIASSLAHEVGHQAAALLDLVSSVRPVLGAMRSAAGPRAIAWALWDRWISEILADFWSVARIGIASTVGLIAVVSLPRPFVFRVNTSDPHPTPWIRVKLSCAIGRVLFPHRQWDALARIWEQLYPLDGLGTEKRAILEALQATMAGFADLLANHRPRALRGVSLREALAVNERQPAHLAQLFQQNALRHARPSLVFAAIGQARADGRIAPARESNLLSGFLTQWALNDALGVVSTNLSNIPSRRHRHE
jgi:hypothetical protein